MPIKNMTISRKNLDFLSNALIYQVTSTHDSVDNRHCLGMPSPAMGISSAAQ